MRVVSASDIQIEIFEPLGVRITRLDLFLQSVEEIFQAFRFRRMNKVVRARGMMNPSLPPFKTD